MPYMCASINGQHQCEIPVHWHNDCCIHSSGGNQSVTDGKLT